MNVKTPQTVASALFACLILAPGCYAVDDPAMPAENGSSGEVDDPTGGEAPNPTGNNDDGTTGQSTTGDEGTTGGVGTTGEVDTTGGDGESGGEESSGEEGETTSAVDAPTILEVLPEDGAIGVAAGDPILVLFSEPMDKASTQAAYQSADIPAGSVTFSWNDAGDALTITPNDPLDYAEGTSAATTDALSYAFTISSAGESEGGVSLEDDTEVSFSTLRRLSLSYTQDTNLSGRIRDLGGATLLAGSYSLGDNTINDTGRGFVTFDVSSLPEGPVTVEDGNLHARFSTVQGNPFIDLGAVVYQHVSYETFNDALFDAEALGTASGLFATINDDEVDRDVTDIAAAAVEDPDTFGERVQFRFRWVFSETDNDGQTDGVTMVAGDLGLDLQVLVP